MALFKILSRNYRRYDRNRTYDWAPTHALTLATWFNGQHASFDQHMVGMSAMGYRLFLRSLGGYSHLSANLGIKTITNPEPILKNKWTHAAMVWTGLKLKLFSNGSLAFIEDVNDIRYLNELYGTSIWAFENTKGGNSHQLGLNLFTMWGAALHNAEIEYLAAGGNPANVQYEGIQIGDFLDEVDTSGTFGDFMPDRVVNNGIIKLPPSPFSGGKVPYPVPEIFISSSSSSISSESSPSSHSTSLSSESSPSSLSSISGTISQSSDSSSSSSADQDMDAVFGPGLHSLVIPANVNSIDIYAWGGGGGGGGTLNRQSYVYFEYATGGGGGGGAYAKAENVAVAPADVLDIAVGAGGKAGNSKIVDLTQNCGNNTAGEDGGPTCVSNGTIDLINIEGGSGGGKGYIESVFSITPQPGDGGSGGSVITTPANGTPGNDGDRGSPAIRAFFWPPSQLGGIGGKSGNPGWGDGGNGANSDNSCHNGHKIGQQGNGGRVEIKFNYESSSSSLTSESSLDESDSSSTASSDTSKSSLSSAG